MDEKQGVKTAAGDAMAELLEGCRRGNVKQIRTCLTSQRLDAEQKDQALKIAAEYGQPAAFEAILLEHEQPDEQTLLHAAKWALRYHDRRIMGLVMQADTNRWLLSREYLEELRALEVRRPKPDHALVYLLDRLFAQETK